MEGRRGCEGKGGQGEKKNSAERVMEIFAMAGRDFITGCGRRGKVKRKKGRQEVRGDEEGMRVEKVMEEALR